jgi:1,4-alpha-glucan branching enzyme
MQQLNDLVDQRFPRKIQIAEDLQRNEWLTRPTRGGGAGFDAQWDVFVHAVREALTRPDDADRSMAAVRDAIAARYNGNPFQRVIYTESHDEVANGKKRLPDTIDPANPTSVFARKRSILGAALVFTAPGIPMLFQGQEFLEDEWFRDTDPLDWTRAERFADVLAVYRSLAALRRNLAGTTRGLLGPNVNVFHVNDRDKAIAFHRWQAGGPGDDVVVIANFANRPYAAYRVGFPRAGPWKVRLDTDGAARDVEATAGARDGLAFQGDVALGAYAAVVLSQ